MERRQTSEDVEQQDQNPGHLEIHGRTSKDSEEPKHETNFLSYATSICWTIYHMDNYPF